MEKEGLNKTSMKSSHFLPNTAGALGVYSIFQNDKGEILLMLEPREGTPEDPLFIYDGGDTALLVRNMGSNVTFRHIGEDARESLKSVKKILVHEVLGNDVVWEYTAPVRLVKNVKGLML